MRKILVLILAEGALFTNIWIVVAAVPTAWTVAFAWSLMKGAAA